MAELFSIVEQFFLKYNLHKFKKIAIGFSGGYDSVCLLNITKELSLKYGFQVFALHLNHNWRGEESLKDELSCKDFCKKIEVEFYSETLPENCIKTETVARNYRYDFFERCIKKFNLDGVLTAHNANDNAETVLYRIAKGTGIAGLQAINEVRGKFYRPLLKIKRPQIEEYCKENSLPVNIDSSNFNTKYKRNLIRNKIIPLFEEINPSVIDSINSLSFLAKEENEMIEEILKEKKEKIVADNKILTQEFLKLSSTFQKRIIRKILIENNIDYDFKTISKLLNFIQKNKSCNVPKITSLNSEKFLKVSSKEIFIENLNLKNNFELVIEKEGIYEFDEQIFEIKRIDFIPENFPKDEEKIAFCSLKNYDFPFVLRTKREGDYFYPLGGIGKQKIKKFFNSKKIPLEERENIILFSKNSEILWIGGYGLSDKIKVHNRPDFMLKLLNK